MVCCLHPEFVGIPSNPFFWNLPNSIGSNKIPNYDGSQLDRGSFHELLCLFPLQTHLVAHCSQRVHPHQSAGLVPRMHQSWLDGFLQAFDAEFCGQDAAEGFSEDSSMRATFVQVWLNSWTTYGSVYHIYQEGFCNQTGVLTCYSSNPMSNFLFSSKRVVTFIDIKIRAAQQNTRAVLLTNQLPEIFAVFLTKTRSTHQTNQLKGISTFFVAHYPNPKGSLGSSLQTSQLQLKICPKPSPWQTNHNKPWQLTKLCPTRF